MEERRKIIYFLFGVSSLPPPRKRLNKLFFKNFDEDLVAAARSTRAVLCPGYLALAGE